MARSYPPLGFRVFAHGNWSNSLPVLTREPTIPNEIRNTLRGGGRRSVRRLTCLHAHEVHSKCAHAWTPIAIIDLCCEHGFRAMSQGVCSGSSSGSDHVYNGKQT